MLASRHGSARRVQAPDWDIEVLPPTEAAFDSGSHVYRCIANEIGHEPSTSQFGRWPRRHPAGCRAVSAANTRGAILGLCPGPAGRKSDSYGAVTGML